jgi:hypothetical protein
VIGGLGASLASMFSEMRRLDLDDGTCLRRAEAVSKMQMDDAS